VLRNPRQHARTDFLAIMECEHEVRPTCAWKCLVRARLPLVCQPNLFKAESTALAFAEGHWLMNRMEQKC
jgi:hypothetical protein